MQRLIIIALFGAAGSLFWFAVDRLIGPNLVYAWGALALSIVLAIVGLVLAGREWPSLRILAGSGRGQKVTPFTIALLVSLVAALTWAWYFWDKNRGPIVWIDDENSPLSFTRSGDSPTFVYAFQIKGRNRSSDPINPMDAFVKSNINGTILPLQFNADGRPVSEKVIAPSPNGDFVLIAVLPSTKGPYSGGFTFAEFRRDFGSFTINFTYEGGPPITRRLERAKVNKLLENGDRAIEASRPKPPSLLPKNSPPTPKRAHSKLEKECIQDALFKLTDVINKKVKGLNPAIHSVSNNWEASASGALKANPPNLPETLLPFLTKLEEIRIAAESAHIEIYDGIPKEYAGCASDINEVLGGSALAQIATALVKFHEGLTTLTNTQINDHNIEGVFILLRPLQGDVRNATHRLHEWLEGCNERMKAKRKEIDA